MWRKWGAVSVREAETTDAKTDFARTQLFATGKNEQMRVRALIPTILVVQALMPPAYGFAGKEHQDISDRALKIAHARVKSMDPSFREPAEALLGAGGCTFGKLTLAADWYEKPEGLAATHDCDDLSVRDRFGIGTIKHLAALHHNERHFQAGAVRAYQDLHDQALKAHDRTTALWLEAFALHYLQDFFAPGHIVSPRARSDDTAAAGVHDLFNHLGADVHVNTVALNDELRKRFGDRFKFSAAVVRFLGDGSLEPAQSELLVALSALSISDVFERRRATLSLCYQSRSALPRVNGSRPMPKTFHGPFASAGINHNPSRTDCDCHEGALLRYDFQGREELQYHYLTPWSWKVSTASDLHGRAVLDIGVVSNMYEPDGSLRKRSSGESNTECTRDSFFDNSVTRGGSIHLTLVRDRYYRGTGIHVQNGMTIGSNLIFAYPYAGVRRYRWQTHTAYRLEPGVKFIAGLHVLNLQLIIERSYRVDSTGRIRSRFLFMPGVEVNIAKGWLKPRRSKP